MSFEYFKAQALSAAAEKARAASSPCIVAGGTDVMVKLRHKKLAPDVVIDIAGLKEISGITEDADTITIGAAVTHDEIVHSPLIRKYAAVLAEGAEHVGSPQIRHMATVGGNLCNASPAADTAPPIMVLDGELTLSDGKEVSTVPVEDFFYIPGKPKLEKGQLLTGIKIKKLQKDQGAAFYKIGKRLSLAIAILNGASLLEVSEGKITKVRIALGCVAAKPLRLTKAEEFLLGKAPTEENFIKAGEIAADSIVPIDDIRAKKEYRKGVAAKVVKKTLEMAYAQCGEEK